MKRFDGIIAVTMSGDCFKTVSRLKGNGFVISN